MAPSLLKNLVADSEEPSPVITFINGSLFTPIQPVLFNILSHVSPQSHDIHFILTRKLQSQALRDLISKPNVELYFDQSLEDYTTQSCPFSNAVNAIKRSSSAHKPVLVIEEASDVLRYVPLQLLLRQIREIVNVQEARVLICSSRECLYHHQYSSLKHFADCSIALHRLLRTKVENCILEDDHEEWPSNLEKIVGNSTQFISRSEYRKPSGKWKQSLDTLSYNPETLSLTIEAITVSDKKISIAGDDSAAAFSKLTFNVLQNEKEKAAKDELVLPFQRAIKSDSSSQSLILYDLEKDDFDEDDPDDDLDI